MIRNAQGNRLIVKRVRVDTESFHAWGYPPHEKRFGIHPEQNG